MKASEVMDNGLSIDLSLYYYAFGVFSISNLYGYLYRYVHFAYSYTWKDEEPLQFPRHRVRTRKTGTSEDI